MKIDMNSKRVERIVTTSVGMGIAAERVRCTAWIRILIRRWPKPQGVPLSPLQKDLSRVMEGIKSGKRPKLNTKRFANKT